MDWQIVLAALGILISVGGALGSAAAVFWRVGKSEGTVTTKVDGVVRQLDSLMRGESATCAAHRAELDHLRTETVRHQTWLEGHSDAIRNHGDRLTRLETITEDG
jgi:hypothetical protein